MITALSTAAVMYALYLCYRRVWLSGGVACLHREEEQRRRLRNDADRVMTVIQSVRNYSQLLAAEEMISTFCARHRGSETFADHHRIILAVMATKRRHIRLLDKPTPISMALIRYGLE